MDIELPVEFFIKPVQGHDDLLSFTYPFAVKALDGTDSTVEELEDGDLIIEGLAADFSGLDREGENFAPGAFQRGIKSFLSGSAPLCFHHKRDQILGKVLELEEVEGKGLRMRARIDGATKNHPVLGVIYEQIRRGTINALSVGGFFRRKLTDTGRKIVDMDFVEISATATPVHPGTNFAVVAGKALAVGETAEEENPASVDPDELEALGAVFDRFDTFFGSLSAKALPAKHDPKDAAFLSSLLAFVGQARTIASRGRDDANDAELVALADEVETTASKWEATAHKLAAKVGPLPANTLV